METGLITAENIAQVMRTLSQRRRQGTLVLHYQEGDEQVHFCQGKIVEIEKTGRPPADELFQVFVEASLAQRKTPEFIKTYAEVLSIIGDAEKVKIISKQRLLSRMHALVSRPSTHYDFTVRMPDFDHEFCIGVTVGQLLLDFVEIPSTFSRFEGIFKPSTILCLGSASIVFSELEQLIVDVLTEPQAVDALVSKCMLSGFQFQETLLGLYERNIVVIQGEKQSSVSGETTKFSESLFASLDSSLDGIFAESELTSPAVVGEEGPVEVADRTRDGALGSLTDFKSRLAILDAQLLQSRAIPDVVLLLFLLAVFFIPVFLWGEYLVQF